MRACRRRAAIGFGARDRASAGRAGAGPELPSGGPPGAAGGGGFAIRAARSRLSRGLRAGWSSRRPRRSAGPRTARLGSTTSTSVCTAATTAARHYFGWHVLCALAYQGERRKLVHLEAFTNATRPLGGRSLARSRAARPDPASRSARRWYPETGLTTCCHGRTLVGFLTITGLPSTAAITTSGVRRYLAQSPPPMTFPARAVPTATPRLIRESRLAGRDKLLEPHLRRRCRGCLFDGRDAPYVTDSGRGELLELGQPVKPRAGGRGGGKAAHHGPSACSNSMSHDPLKPVWPVTSPRRPRRNPGSITEQLLSGRGDRHPPRSASSSRPRFAARAPC